MDTLLDNSGKYDLFGGFMTDCVDLILINDISIFNVTKKLLKFKLIEEQFNLYLNVKLFT